MAEEVDAASKAGHRGRVGLVIASALSTFLFVGAIFGWGPMQLLLEKEGVFHQQCQESTAEESSFGDVCPAQTSSLLQISLISQLTQFVSPLLGYIIDRYSPRTLAYAMAAFQTTGLGLVIVSLAYHWDRLLYLAFSLISIHTWMGGMLLIPVGFYFTERTRVRVTSLLNSLFDASGITYLGLWALAGVWQNTTLLLVCYFALSVLVSGVGVYFWVVAVPVVEEEKRTLENSDSLEDETDAKPVDTGNEEVDAANDDCALVESATPTEGIEQKLETEDASDDDDEPRYVLVADRTQKQQLLSMPYWVLIVNFSVHIVANQWNTSTIRDFLAELGDDEKGNRYLTIYTLLHPVSLLGLPFVDQVIARYGFQGGLQVVNLLAFGYTLVKVTSRDLNVQILGFVLFSFYRCFLFSVTFSFLPTFLSVDVMGKATGIIFFCVALVSILNIPLATWAVEGLDSFFIPNLMWLCLVLPCVLTACYLGRFIAWEEKQRAINMRQKR